MGLEEFILQQQHQAGIEKGMYRGMKKGREEGLEKGLEQGLKKGLEKGKLIAIENLILQTDFSDDTIANICSSEPNLVNSGRIRLKN